MTLSLGIFHSVLSFAAMSAAVYFFISDISTAMVLSFHDISKFNDFGTLSLI